MLTMTPGEDAGTVRWYSRPSPTTSEIESPPLTRPKAPTPLVACTSTWVLSLLFARYSSGSNSRSFSTIVAAADTTPAVKGVEATTSNTADAPGASAPTAHVTTSPLPEQAPVE